MPPRSTQCGGLSPPRSAPAVTLARLGLTWGRYLVCVAGARSVWSSTRYTAVGSLMIPDHSAHPGGRALLRSGGDGADPGSCDVRVVSWRRGTEVPLPGAGAREDPITTAVRGERSRWCRFPHEAWKGSSMAKPPLT